MINFHIAKPSVMDTRRVGPHIRCFQLRVLAQSFVINIDAMLVLHYLHSSSSPYTI
jgi:hypothetical protein